MLRSFAQEFSSGCASGENLPNRGGSAPATTAGRGNCYRLRTGEWKGSARGQRSEARGQRSEVGGQRSEVGGQRSEVRGRRSEVRGQRSEVRGRELHPQPPASSLQPPASSLYLKRSSNARRALLVGGDSDLLAGVLVCRSMVVRGVKNAQLLRSSFGATRAGSFAFSVHSHRALVSNDTH